MSIFKRPFKDAALEDILKRLPRLPQRQYDTDTQMRYLVQVANMFGLYDAADILNAIINRRK